MHFRGYLFLLFCIACAGWRGAAALERCATCHAVQRRGLGAHAMLASACTVCHRGNPDATRADAAHRGLIAFPGDMTSAARVCGPCHADKVAGVEHSLMQTGAGMIATTRAVFGEAIERAGHDDLSHLTNSPADSLLRKLCADCHLGEAKTAHRLDPTSDRGGGCLACHVNAYPPGRHPMLSASVSDARCFGCHSRSGRISLNYAGLGEIDSAHAMAASLHLADGRAVQRRPDDVHHRAGMGCIDCHTEADLMGLEPPARHERDALDISCVDCHRNRAPRLDVAHWPSRYRALLRKVPFEVTPATRFLVTARHGTPLWNIELRADGAYLYPKKGGTGLKIPPYRPASHPLALAHRDVTCETCHSQWAPQCYGCHVSDHGQARGWDYLTGGETPGVWHEVRGEVRNDLPPLGVTDSGRIVPVGPGMILTAQYPTQPQERFVRRFARLSPHTIGQARSCASCHRSPTALGLGRGRLTVTGGNWTFTPAERRLRDGLPADGWTTLDAPTRSVSSGGVHPLSQEQIRRILRVPLKSPGTPLRQQ